MPPVPRTGARLLLIDPHGRVLLIHEDLWPKHLGSHWITPGGGVEAGESPQRAAEREAYEETGLIVRVPDDAEPVLRTQRQWQAPGVVYDQADVFFAARVEADPTLRAAALTESERDLWIGFGWWSVAELRATTETILPAELPDVLERLSRSPGWPGDGA